VTVGRNGVVTADVNAREVVIMGRCGATSSAAIASTFAAKVLLPATWWCSASASKMRHPQGQRAGAGGRRAEDKQNQQSRQPTQNRTRRRQSGSRDGRSVRSQKSSSAKKKGTSVVPLSVS
jgi:hypothetical protein